ncbi:rhomboid family intramembrane serine protease [Microbacterium amylolyticum]|uniref:Membrane associated rhomboid family serine protease n=1 Tax=Microbacterium amylolyticum TaxID=936337 RepID=A0ABS4ZGU3_9MICO|nr:rhomboid family intramembrane serine protease [Microbacterium amylolyticum]MBP2436497.1 membrane associated rhomboid family serine protease [Microbacterium amylolyticum]
MTQQPTEKPRNELLFRFAQPAVLLIILWGMQTLQWILPVSFAGLGVRSWRFEGLLGIVTSPLVHSGWPHLIANSATLLVLGALVSLEGAKRFWTVTAVATVVGGAGAWIVNTPGTVTIGASGIVFGYFGYLLMRAFVAPNVKRTILYAVVALAVAVSYGGSMFTGIFRAGDGVSWQAHLFGALGGALAAWLARPRTAPQRT